MKKLILFLICILTVNSYACFNGDKLFRKNMYISTNEKSNLDQQDFEDVIADVVDIYKPIMKDMGLTLKSFANWNSSQVNARADRKGRIRRIIIFGGIGRHKLVNKDELRLIICHEIGHHIGGAPKASSWASGEGQADYFASTKCLRKVFLKYPIELDLNQVPKNIVQKCENAFEQYKDVQVCVRSSITGLNTAKLFAELNGTTPPDPQMHDPSVVTSTKHRHPLPQCRFDTYSAGANCSISHHTAFSSKDETIGACHEINGHFIGIRPKCWFKAKNNP